jgi:hypothetical protein
MLERIQKGPIMNDDSPGSAGSALPESGSSRRSARLVGVERNYIVQDLFPILSDTEVEDEDDGIVFCWRDED